VSCLSFLDGGRVLVSGGEDALLCVWMAAECTDCTRDPNNPAARIQAFYTWCVMMRTAPYIHLVRNDADCSLHPLGA
jgi:hypothetical protein